MDDLDALEAAARAAPAYRVGAWRPRGGEGCEGYGDASVADESGDEVAEVRAWDGGHVARYIAAASPDVVRALIARVRAAEAERDEARAITKGISDTARMIAREYGQ